MVETQSLLTTKTGFKVPVIALTFYAVASGYMMSLIPLVLEQYGLNTNHASWLASVFYAGLLFGAITIEPLVKATGHRWAFVICLAIFVATIAVMPVATNIYIWLAARFIAGMAVAGVFVIVESWLLDGEDDSRTKRLGLYMGALYGGSALGQMGIGALGTHGLVPFIAIVFMLSCAIAVLVFCPTSQPMAASSTPLSFKQVAKLNHAAVIGCVVSGLTLGAIYGLMPLELSTRNVSQNHLSVLMTLVILGGMAVQTMVPKLSKIMGRALLMGLFCLLGVFATGMVIINNSLQLLTISLFLLGMATFALYPIAINLGCDKLDRRFIVSATQVMLFCYSIGSVVGPLFADWFMQGRHGLMAYLFAIQMATAIYMLVVSVKTKKRMVAGG